MAWKADLTCGGQRLTNEKAVFLQTLVYVIRLEGELLRLRMLTMGFRSVRVTVGALSVGMGAGRWFKVRLRRLLCSIGGGDGARVEELRETKQPDA